jgi:hypothetical protein
MKKNKQSHRGMWAAFKCISGRTRNRRKEQKRYLNIVK